MDAILYLVDNGIKWRALPADFPPWSRVYNTSPPGKPPVSPRTCRTVRATGFAWPKAERLRHRPRSSTPQELPFSWVVRRLAPTRDPGRNPLFQVMFSLDDTGARPARWGADLRVRGLPFPIDAAKFDLDLTVRPGRDGSLAGELIYSTDLFEDATAAAYARAFASLVDRLTADPDRCLADVAVAEVEPAAPAETSGPPAVHRLVWDQASRMPRAPAIVTGETTLSYAELVARAEELAGRLRAAGVGAEDVVALCLPRGADFIVGALATMHAGAAYLPVDPAQPEPARRRVLDSARPAVIIDETMALGAGRPARPDHPARAAYVIYTSGSTGTPKGVVVSHSTLSGSSPTGPGGTASGGATGRCSCTASHSMCTSRRSTRRWPRVPRS